MASLFFDGDKRRIYEVPDNSSFVVDGNGYRIYTPNNPLTAEAEITFDDNYVWSRWVDFHNANKWALLCFDISGGAYRYTDATGDVYALIDLRFTNEWAYVPADYPHDSTLKGNFLPDTVFGDVFDTARITSIPVPQVKVEFSDRGERVVVSGGGGTSEDELYLNAGLVSIRL